MRAACGMATLRRVGQLTTDRVAARRRAKLAKIRKQVSSGSLVIREMTEAERDRWARQHAAVEAKLTQAQRDQRAAALRARRAAQRKRGLTRDQDPRGR